VSVAAGLWVSCNIYTPDLLVQGLIAQDGGPDEDGAVPPDDGASGFDVPGEDGCAPGLGRCGQTQCNVQFTVDPKNCGACGHDCRGGPCLGGACQPILVASQQSAPAFIAVDDTGVYWTNSGDGTVMRSNKDGTGQLKIASGQDTPWVIRVRKGRVYWGDDDTGGFVGSAPAAGGGPVLNMTGPQPSPRGLDVDDQYVYFDTEDTDAGTFQRVQLDGGGLTVIASQQGSPKDVIVTPTAVFWSNAADGTIMRYDVAGGTFAPFVKNLVNPFGMGWDGTFIYWTCHVADAGCVGRVAMDGSQKTILASGQQLPRAIAVDATYMYFTDEGDGTVRRVPSGGGQLETLASGQVQPWGIAIDDEFVYWAAKGAGTILKVAK
jgi:hypothetical protein